MKIAKSVACNPEVTLRVAKRTHLTKQFINCYHYSAIRHCWTIWTPSGAPTRSEKCHVDVRPDASSQQCSSHLQEQLPEERLEMILGHSLAPVQGAAYSRLLTRKTKRKKFIRLH